MSDIFGDDDIFGSYKSISGDTTSSSYGSDLDSDGEIGSLSDGFRIDHPKVGMLWMGTSLVAFGLLAWLINNWKLSIVGYVLAVATILLAGRFQQNKEELRAGSRYYAPLKWTDKVTVGVIAGAFLAAGLNVWRVAHELAIRYTLFGIVALLSVAAAAGGIAIDSAPASAQVGVQDQSALSVYEDFFACVADGNTGLVQVIVDESASLEDTDPRDERVQALQSTLSNLDVARRNSGGEISIEVLLAGFAVDYSARTAWVSLDDASLAGLLSTAREFADRDHGLDTDYYLALEGARGVFQSRSDEIISAGAPAPCQMLFWLTDGEYSVEDRNSPGRIARGGSAKSYLPGFDLTNGGAGAKAVTAGTSLMCAPNGVMNELRVADTRVIAVTLIGEGVKAQDFSLVEAAVTRGLVNNIPCGNAPAVGAVISQTDPGQGIAPGSNPVQFPYDFEIDELVSAFTLNVSGVQLDGQSGRPGIRLSGPEDGPLLLAYEKSTEGVRQTTDLGHHTVSWTWYSDSRVFVETDVAQGRATGTWKTRFTAESKPDVEIRKFGGYEIELRDVGTLRPGETGTVEIAIVGDNGADLGSSVVDQLDLTATLGLGEDQSALVFTPTPSGTFQAEIDVPDDFEGESADLAIAVAPKASDTSVAAKSKRFDLRISSPPGFPVIGKTRTANIDGTGTTRIIIPIQGDPASAGCVQFGKTQVLSSPSGYTGDGWKLGSGPVDCVAVAAGESTEVTIDFEVTERGRGRFEGEVELTLESDQSTHVVSRTIEFGTSVIPIADASTEWLLRILLLLIGLAIPLGVMFLSKSKAGRYTRSSELRKVTVPVEVTPAGLDPTADWDEELGEDWMSGDVHEPPVHVGFNFGRKLGLNPFKPARATVTASGSAMLVGSDGKADPSGTGRGGAPVGFISFGLRGSWVVALEEPDFPGGTSIDDPGAVPDSATGQLVTFVTDFEELQVVLSDADFRVPAAFSTHEWAGPAPTSAPDEIDLRDKESDDFDDLLGVTSSDTASPNGSESRPSEVLQEGDGPPASTGAGTSDQLDDPFAF